MKKVLFVSSFIGIKQTGGSVLSKRNLNLCKTVFAGFEIDAYGFQFSEIPDTTGINYLPSYKNSLSTFINYLLGYAGGLSFSSNNTLTELVKKNNYAYIFLDGSLLGKLALTIKKIFPQIKIITFFHNVEREFFKKSFRHKPLYTLLYKSVCYNENLSVKYADIIICLNKRDVEIIEKVYGRKPENIFPATVEDRFKKESLQLGKTEQITILFVGSDFYANAQGLKWFAKKVMPNINATLLVVGKGLEKYKQELDSEKINVIGTVENTDNYYYHSNLFVAPIFTGAGMKLKIAEALMMGKTIIGTTEAWQGYDVENGYSGFICNTAEEFISTINLLSKEHHNLFNKNARELYCKSYSPLKEITSIKSLKKQLFPLCS